MERRVTPTLVILQRSLQLVAITIIALLTMAMTVATVLAIAGVLPWLELPVTVGGTPVENAGVYAQLGLNALLLMLCLYLPSNLRVLRLESSHRDFQLKMEDVANAYWATHRADRTGVFQMKSEFDAVKERLLWLRDHPELHTLEPDVLELAAQMSRQSEELARIYSDEAVAHAREVLEQRIHEANRLESEIERAHAVCRDLRQYVDTVEIEEDVIDSRIARLREDLTETLGKLGLAIADITPANDTAEDSPEVIKLPAPGGRRGSVSVAAE